jgi:hypothetical protein
MDTAGADGVPGISIPRKDKNRRLERCVFHFGGRNFTKTNFWGTNYKDYFLLKASLYTLPETSLRLRLLRQCVTQFVTSGLESYSKPSIIRSN